jgi:hypothetical protein
MGWTSKKLELKSQKGQEIYLLLVIQTGSEDHPDPYPMGLFPCG